MSKIYIIIKSHYEYTEILDAFYNKEDAESFLFQLIMYNGRINISDKAIEKEYNWYYNIEEIEIE